MRAGELASDPRDDVRAPDDHAPVQLHALRIGMRTILLVPLFATAAMVLTRRTVLEMGPFGWIFVAFAVAAGLATLLPYERLFRTGWGMAIVSVWSVINLGLIAIGIWATGGPSSPLMFLYTLTTLFFAVAFTPRAQALLLALTVASCSVALGPSRWSPLSLLVLAVLAFLANLLVRQLKRQTAAHREARVESERRWAVLAVVSAAARQMAAVEPRVVLRAVVDSVVALGFPRTRMYIRESEGYRAILSPDGTDDSNGIDSLRSEAIKRASGKRKPVVVGDGDEALGETLRRLGLSSLVVVPIRVAGRAEAFMVVGVEDRDGPSSQDVEVFEMLTTQAAVALENARRFEQQRRSMDRMAELDRMKSDFLSNISHELRTPLTVIAGVGRTLEEGSAILSEEDRRDLLARLNANAATLDRIVAELLDFGRLESGQLEIEPVDVDLRQLLEGVTDRLTTLFVDHALEVAVEDGLSVNADPLLIERVVENLLTNAAKYTPAGSHIHVSAISEGREAIVAVEDDGPGIPPDELAHIGERFFRGGHVNTRTARGTGLGLALSSEILDLHGTYLEVESTVDVGSRFSFQLPRGHVRDRSTTGAVASTNGRRPETPPLVVSDVGLPDRFETILAAAQTGLEWPVAALFRDLHPRLLRYLRAHLPERAEALAVATWNEIASDLPAFEGDEASFRRWVFAAARHRLEDARQGDSSSTSLRIVREGDASLESRAVDAALANIRALPREQADVLLLRVLGDLKTDDVAEIIGDSADRVRMTEIEGLRHLHDRAAVARLLELDRAGSGTER
jgi:signal transduction histidine kinase/DNA-directed RNA polymerase specialized sigma24 family protein